LRLVVVAGVVCGVQGVDGVRAPGIGYWSELWGRKRLLLVGFGTEAARALLFSVVTEPWVMILVQLLDGVTGAVVTVLTILVITDLTTGTGRFNLAQGVVGTLIGISAATSTAVSGFIVSHFGDWLGFVSMAALTIAGLALLWVALPETKPAEYID